MPAHTIPLEIGFNARIFISAKKARELVKSDKAEIVSKEPYALRLKERVTRWTEQSDGGKFLMNGALFHKVRI